MTGLFTLILNLTSESVFYTGRKLAVLHVFIEKHIQHNIMSVDL